nr:histidine kinase [Planctomycetota bacterium]
VPALVAMAERATPEQAAELIYLREEIPRAIEQSLDGISRVASIVRAMKEFSHPDRALKQAVDLNHAIETTLTVARNEYKYVADLVVELDPGLPPVPCFVGEINQTILNLVVNAAHAIAEVPGQRGRIGVATRFCDDVAEIRISDTGPGIPDHVRPRLFTPFFTTKPVGKGTGQGLFLAHSVVVRRHGGTIAFETEVGRGTVFIVRLPLRDVALGAA